MDELTLTVFDTDDAHRALALRILGEHLNEHHRWATGGECRQLFVTLCDQAGKVCGGIVSCTHGLWLDVEFVWVAELLRRRGHGSQMLAAAEAEARARGCRRVYLDTGASPAAGFFLARGYRACGELADYRDGRTRYWLQKVLDGTREGETDAAPQGPGK